MWLIFFVLLKNIFSSLLVGKLGNLFCLSEVVDLDINF